MTRTIQKIWLTNMIDPRRADPNKVRITTGDETQWEARENEDRYLRGKVFGKPKATETYTAAQLEKMGMVGIYKLDCPPIKIKSPEASDE